MSQKHYANNEKEKSLTIFSTSNWSWDKNHEYNSKESKLIGEKEKQWQLKHWYDNINLRVAFV